MSTCKKPNKTPSRALRLVDFGFTNWHSQTKQQNSQTVVQSRRCGSMAPPMSQPKRLIELFDDMMPPPGRAPGTTAKVSAKKFQIHKTHLSTSKKHNNRKTDHAVVRRALNFIGNQMDNVQLHSKSKPITRMSVVAYKAKHEDTKPKGVNISSQTNEQKKRKYSLEVGEKSTIEKNSMDLTQRYDLRSYKKMDKIDENSLSIEYTQYRNVAQSLDDSVTGDENSPKIVTLEKSMIELHETTQKQSDASDVLCDMLLKTNISSPNLSHQIQLINSKITENNQFIHLQMEFMDSISNEIEKNKQKLSLCLENNKHVLELMSNLTNKVKHKNNSHSMKRRSIIPLARKSLIPPILNKVLADEPDFVKNNCDNDVDTISNNNEDEDKENISNLTLNKKTPSKYNCKNDLRKAVLLSTLESNKNICVSAKTSSQTQLKISNSPTIRTKIIKPMTPKFKASATKDKTLKCNNSSPVASKSLQIYKSLKDSVKFLKTPKGKKSTPSDISFETPNTRSRNITSNNIKRQLESLYDS